MANKFFDGWIDGLGEKLSQTAKELSGHAETIYETQKLRTKISNENRAVDKLMADLGNIIYKQYIAGAELDEEQKALCEQIDQHMVQIDKFAADLANMQGKKICPSCQQKVAKNVAFCPNCGAACPTPEEEPEEEEIVDMPEENEGDVCPECEECAEESAEELITEEAVVEEAVEEEVAVEEAGNEEICEEKTEE